MSSAERTARGRSEVKNLALPVLNVAERKKKQALRSEYITLFESTENFFGKKFSDMVGREGFEPSKA